MDKSEISIKFYFENGRIFADVPDDVFQKHRLFNGEELEIALSDSRTVNFIQDQALFSPLQEYKPSSFRSRKLLLFLRFL